MDEQINYNLKQLSTWKRIFFMLVFAAIGSLVRMILWAVIILQSDHSVDRESQPEYSKFRTQPFGLHLPYTAIPDFQH